MFETTQEIQPIKKPTDFPKALFEYSYTPPAFGYMLANSAKTRAINMETTIARIHEINELTPAIEAAIPGAKKCQSQLMH